MPSVIYKGWRLEARSLDATDPFHYVVHDVTIPGHPRTVCVLFARLKRAKNFIDRGCHLRTPAKPWIREIKH